MTNPDLNQIPDRNAGRAAGQRYWDVRPGAPSARWSYLSLSPLLAAPDNRTDTDLGREIKGA